MSEKKFPPDGYVPTRSVVDGIVVFMPAPEIDDYEKRVEFACPNCGGVQAYSVTDGGLSCTSCGYYQPPQGVRVGRGASTNEFRTKESEREKQARLERQLGASLATGSIASQVATDSAKSGRDVADLSTAETQALSEKSASAMPKYISKSTSNDDYDWGSERQELECTNCGASILLDPKSLTHVCPFCGSSSVVQHAFAYDKLRPRYLIPFTVQSEEALSKIKDWLGNSWMTPNDLQQRAGLDELTGIYLPYWTFSAVCSSDWKAEVGRTKTRTRNGKTETYTEWRWEHGSVRLPIQDLLIPGTAKLNQRLLDEVDQFDMHELVEYSVDYLAGFNAQTYDVDRDIGWARGREVMREQTKSACRGQASTSQIRNFSMTLDYADESWRYVLLPVYLTTYRYDTEQFSVMANGQTGYITGQRPVDWRKVGAAIVVSFIPAAIAALSALFFFEGDNAQNVLVFAGVLAVLALAIAGGIGWSAMNVRKAS